MSRHADCRRLLPRRAAISPPATITYLMLHAAAFAAVTMLPGGHYARAIA